MGKKKGMGKKKKKGGDDEQGESKEDIKKQITEYKDAYELERGHRNFFQLERDKLYTFWEITKKELQEGKAALRNKQREKEEMLERHSIEVKVYKQRVKHLLYEHKNQNDQMKVDEEMQLDSLNEERLKEESSLKYEQRQVQIELKEAEYARAERLRIMRREQDRLMTEERQQFERKAKEMQNKYEKKMRVLRDDLENRRKKEIDEIEQRKDRHIDLLMKKHQSAFTEIKNYYNDITHSNLDLIRNLKQEVTAMKQKEATDEKQLHSIAQENKRLSEPLTTALREVEMLRQQLAFYEKDKQTLAYSKSRLLVMEDELQQKQWETEVMTQRFAAVQKQRDAVYLKFEEAIAELQQKNGYKNLCLEKKLEVMQDTVTRKDAIVNEVLKATAELDNETKDSLSGKVDDVFMAKSRQVQDLNFQLSQVTKSYNDMVVTLKGHLVDAGVPVEELNFQTAPAAADHTPAGVPVA